MAAAARACASSGPALPRRRRRFIQGRHIEVSHTFQYKLMWINHFLNRVQQNMLIRKTLFCTLHYAFATT